MDFNSFKLCYLSGGVAYFTTQDVQDQWGDDFDDAPYEHNAGTPYEPAIHHLANGIQQLSPRDWNPDGTPRWQLLQVHYTAGTQVQLLEPCEGHGNSPYSVQDINAKAIPWLRIRRWVPTQRDYVEDESLWAGASYEEFVRYIERLGGLVWVPRQGLGAVVTPAARPDLSFFPEKP